MRKKRKILLAGKRTPLANGTQLPVVSKRVGIILSNTKDSHKLASAVRSIRKKDEESGEFQVSDNTLDLIYQ